MVQRTETWVRVILKFKNHKVDKHSGFVRRKNTSLWYKKELNV